MFLINILIANNRFLLPIFLYLINTKAKKYIFINYKLARKLVKQLEIKPFFGFKPAALKTFNSSLLQLINAVLKNRFIIRI